MPNFNKRMEEKEKRADKAGKLLEEKGSEMNRAEKAFVGTFADKKKRTADVKK